MKGVIYESSILISAVGNLSFGFLTLPLTLSALIWGLIRESGNVIRYAGHCIFVLPFRRIIHSINNSDFAEVADSATRDEYD